MRKVDIRCPACSKKGYLEIPEEIINKSSRGVSAINVEKDKICPHSFVAYIDKNLAVRDCFLTDFQLELPLMEPAQQVEEKEMADAELINVNLIKGEITALSMANLFRANLLKKSVLLLKEGEEFKQHLQKFLKFVFFNSFDYSVNTESEKNYKDNKKQFKNYVIIDEQSVVQDKDKILDPKKVKIERTIVQKFLAEDNSKSSLIILKNEILKTFELAKEIMEQIKNYKGEEKLGKKKLIDQLAETKKIKISFSYLEFLLDIIKNYFSFDLSLLSDYYFPAFGI